MALAVLGVSGLWAQAATPHVVSDRVDSCLRLRVEPGLRAVTIDCVPPATAVDVLEVRGWWVRGRLTSGREGWLAGRFLDQVPGSDEEPGAERNVMKLRALEERIERLSVEKGEVEAQRDRFETALATAQIELEAMKAKLTEALAGADEAKLRAGEIERRLADATAAGETAEAEVASREKQVAALQEELEIRSERLAELELARGTALKRDEESSLLESELTELEERLREAEARAGRAESRAAALQSAAAALPVEEKAVAAVESPDSGRVEALGADARTVPESSPAAVPLPGDVPAEPVTQVAETALVPLEPLVVHEESGGPSELPVREETGLSASVRDELTVNRRAEAEAAVRAAVEAWATAWAAKDAEAYFDAYAEAFAAADGTARAAWEALRRERLARPAFIRVVLENVTVQVDEGEQPMRAQATFRQSYTSDTFSDVVTKRLVLVLENGGWKIVSEEASS